MHFLYLDSVYLLHVRFPFLLDPIPEHLLQLRLVLEGLFVLAVFKLGGAVLHLLLQDLLVGLLVESELGIDVKAVCFVLLPGPLRLF